MAQSRAHSKYFCSPWVCNDWLSRWLCLQRNVAWKSRRGLVRVVCKQAQIVVRVGHML